MDEAYCMRNSRAWQFSVIAGFLALAGTARAASVSYVLDQSNADPLLADGRPYLSVTVADGTSGSIDFTVKVLPSLTDIADCGFGLKGFAFSSAGAADALLRSNIAGLPAGWSVAFGPPAGGFGRLDDLCFGRAHPGNPSTRC
jgi:hypothetical protein